MNPLKRKMFMQQGGMVPQQMMPPPPQQQMMAPPQQMMPPAEMPMAPGPEEVMAEAQRQEGDELVSGILSQVDSAQDYEQLMNAIRGDEVPVEGRRDELAGLVGEPDAEQTPDSVLTLVQPTMAIVDAQGGLDALMQGEADIAMEDESGMPTDMAGGVGSMLMAGQPEEPVQMANGGMVRKMALGTTVNPTAVDQYMNLITGGRPRADMYKDKMEQLSPFFKELLGDTEKRREEDMGRTQLAFAGDVVSNLFTPTAVPTPFLGRLAPAAKNLATNIGDVVAAERDRQDKLDLTTLQTAIAETGADEKTRASIVETLIKANEDKRTFTEMKYDAITDPSYLNNFGSGESNTNSAQTLAGLENVIREKTITDSETGETIVLPASTLNRLQARAIIDRNNQLGEYSDVSPELFLQAQEIVAKIVSKESTDTEEPDSEKTVVGFEDLRKDIEDLNPDQTAEGLQRSIMSIVNDAYNLVSLDAPFADEVKDIDNVSYTLNQITKRLESLFDPDILGNRESAALVRLIEEELPKYEGATANKKAYANQIYALIGSLKVFKGNAERIKSSFQFNNPKQKNKFDNNVKLLDGLINSYEMLANKLKGGGTGDVSDEEIIDKAREKLGLNS